jgi:hypothetical protein
MMSVRRFIATYLSPSERLAELVCGLVMVLTFTLTASFATRAGRAGVRHLLLATLGCNVAWGIIDGVAYIMAQLVARARRQELLATVRAATDEASALDVIARALDPILGEVGNEGLRRSLYRDTRALALTRSPRPPRVERADVLGAAAIFLIDFICTVPAALPFLLLSDPVLALRVSNLLLIAILFAVGYRWAGLWAGNRWLSGLRFASIGIVLVGVAIVLGG